MSRRKIAARVVAPGQSIPQGPITASIADFCELSGLSRRKVYDMLGAGEIEGIHVGTRHLIVIESYRRLVERLRGAV